MPGGDDDAVARRLEAFAARHAAEEGRPPAERPEAILDRATVRIFAAFATAGVDALLLKGAALAQALYEPHERRPYIDIDILAAPDSLGAAGAVLGSLDYRNVSAERGIDEIGGAVVHEQLWLGQAREVTYPLQVELHEWLPGAEADPDVVWRELRRERTEIPLASGLVPALARPGQALQLATHAAQHGPGFAKGLRELTLALDRWSLDVWREAADLAERIGATAAFAVGLRLVGPGAALADRLRLPDAAALTWNVAHHEERPRGTFHLDAFRDAPGLAGKATVVRRALVPDRRWLAYEYPWARRGGLRVIAAWALHMLRAPLWAARAWRFRRRGKRLSP